ncbi:MAG: hypothetical protein JWP81_630, partial [Ferruginibacter sp.]|nr:hypothetical protein [Ferruginibacter sp.]
KRVGEQKSQSMLITMQGNWTVSVKSKNASFPQRFIISGATTGNGTYTGATATPAVNVTGSQWTIAIQNNPGTGFQLSDSKLTFPHQTGSYYQFDIKSNDAGADQDFDDLVLSCTTPASINTFLVYGNVSLYSGRCIFNPCRKGPFVIETPRAFEAALKNPHLRDILTKLYPERILVKVNPNPPDPAPFFKPVVIDLFEEAMQPKTQFNLKRQANDSSQPLQEGETASRTTANEAANINLERSVSAQNLSSQSLFAVNKYDIAKAIDGFFSICNVDPAPGVTLSFEEYDRTVAEQSGGPYTGTGNRRILGDTITDMFGNYIFRFSFDMTFPGLEDASDSFPGQTADVFAYPDVIVKVTGVASWDVLYESAPYYNIPNIKRINLCLPESVIHISSACANGNLIGSLGDVFIGGNQNSSASFSATALRRYGDNNFLEENGRISVTSSLAGFGIECASWGGMIDIFGCIYDETKPLSQNTIRWYTLRIKRAGTSGWNFVSENYKHPLFHKRNLANYNGDDVGAFPTSLHVDGGAAVVVPAYKNIRAELHIGGPDTDWENTHIDRLMQLHTTLYDIVAGEHKPGTFYLRIDAYDGSGNVVSGKTDMIALFIHNKDLNFGFSGPILNDPSIVNGGCGLYRLTDAQMNTPMELSFMANDPEGFVDNYHLTMARCPAPTIALQASPMADTASGASVLSEGISASTHHSCVGYTGTKQEFGTEGMIPVTLQPAVSETGWIKAGEYFTVYSFALTAQKRVTNGYNTGLTGVYQGYGQIMMERLNP